MASKKHRKKKKRKSAEKRKNQADFFAIKFPFSEVPREKLIEGLIELGKSQQEKFDVNLAKVVGIIKSVDTLQTIASLSMYGLFCGITEKGEFSSPLEERQFNQAHIELVQAIALQIAADKRSLTSPHPQNIQELFDTLPELGLAFSLQRLAIMEKDKSEEQKAIIMLQEHIRLHTQNVRNWGYFKRVVSITKRLCKPIDTLFEKQIGIAATALIDIFEFLLRRFERHVNNRFKMFQEIFSEKTVENMIRKYYALNPQFVDTADEFIEVSKRENLSSEQVKSLIFAHSDLTLANDLTFTIQTLSEQKGLAMNSLAVAFDKLSLSFGDLAKERTEFFFLYNPVWRRPLIKLSDGSFFCAIPQAFFSFIFPIFNELLDKQMKTTYQDRRAEFLEAEIERLFTNAFPGCELAANYKWKDDENEYENDLLVRVDSHLILVEAKSHSISWPALRGAPDRAKRHVEEVLLEPSKQSLRLAKRITEVLSNPELRDSFLPNFPLALEQVRTVLRLSVTLEDFAVLQANLHMAKEAGWIPQDHPLAACILLADLEIVFDVLEMTAQKIHYIKRRSELEANMNYMGDEIDLLGFYLVSGFNIGDSEFNGQHFNLGMMSQKIDGYYIALDEGIQRTKPHLKLTQWWKDICNKFEERNFHQWSDVANIILSFSFEEQQKAEKLFNKIKKNVLKNWKHENHLCSVTIIPHMHRSDAFAMYAYREIDKETRNRRMENIASRIFENPHVQRCAIMGINIDTEHYPYSTLAVFFRGKVKGG